MESHTDKEGSSNYERRNFDRRLAELEKHEIEAREQIKRLVSDAVSDKGRIAEIHREIFTDIEGLQREIMKMKESLQERMDQKISFVLGEVKNDFRDLKAESKEQSHERDKRMSLMESKVEGLGQKLLYATGFLAGLQFVLQVLLPWFQAKGLN